MKNSVRNIILVVIILTLALAACISQAMRAQAQEPQHSNALPAAQDSVLGIADSVAYGGEHIIAYLKLSGNPTPYHAVGPGRSAVEKSDCVTFRVLPFNTIDAESIHSWGRRSFELDHPGTPEQCAQLWRTIALRK